MTTPDSALNALSASLTSVDSPLAANLAEILPSGGADGLEPSSTSEPLPT